MEFDLFNPQTLEQGKQLAKHMARMAKDKGVPCAFEVVRTKSKPIDVQPFGMHAMFKSHHLLHVEPIPE